LVRNDRSYHVPWLQLPVDMFVTLQELKYVIDSFINKMTILQFLLGVDRFEIWASLDAKYAIDL